MTQVADWGGNHMAIMFINTLATERFNRITGEPFYTFLVGLSKDCGFQENLTTTYKWTCNADDTITLTSDMSALGFNRFAGLSAQVGTQVPTHKVADFLVTIASRNGLDAVILCDEVVASGKPFVWTRSTPKVDKTTKEVILPVGTQMTDITVSPVMGLTGAHWQLTLKGERSRGEVAQLPSNLVGFSGESAESTVSADIKPF